MRPSPEELKQSLNPTRKKTTEAVQSTKLFLNKKGEETEEVQTPVFGYRTQSGRTNKYFIVVNHDDEPFTGDKQYLAESKKAAVRKGMGEDIYRLIPVKKGAYEAYQSFLQTKQPKFLSEVRRIIQC